MVFISELFIFFTISLQYFILLELRKVIFLENKTMRKYSSMQDFQLSKLFNSYLHSPSIITRPDKSVKYIWISPPKQTFLAFYLSIQLIKVNTGTDEWTVMIPSILPAVLRKIRHLSWRTFVPEIWGLRCLADNFVHLQIKVYHKQFLW